MWEWVHDLSCWLFHQPHSADWWMVGLTAAGAGLILVQLRLAQSAAQRQLEEIQNQITADSKAAAEQLGEMEQSRKASLQPVVVIEQSWPNPGIGGFQIRVRNVGPGPAMNVVVSGWARGTKTNPDTISQERIDEIEASKKTVNIDSPAVRGRIGALGPMQSKDIELRPVLGSGDLDRVTEGFINAGGILLYTISYRDVFDIKFPRKASLAAADLGHIRGLPFRFSPVE
jgi:hypothetical protein